MSLHNEILEFPYKGVIRRIIAGQDGEEDQVVEIYNGVMDETMKMDDEGRSLQTSAHVVSIPLTKDSDGNYIIPIRGDKIELVRYGQRILFNVDNAEPSQLDGVSIYCTRNKW